MSERIRQRRPTVNVIERILRHLPEGLTDEDCWISTYVPGPDGYITIQLDGSYRYGDRMMRRLHRVAWEAHNAEPIPEGMVIMHTCDNPACINPNHLQLGTSQDNSLDMVAKDRHKRPIYNHAQMIELHKQGLSHAAIALELGCNRATVSYALKKHFAS